MRSARGPSSSRRHTGIEPRARTSSTSPSVRSLATTLPAVPPVSFGGGSRAPSSRRDAADRSNNWVSVNFTESSIRLATAFCAVTTEAPHWTGGAGSNRTSVPGRGHDTTALFWTQCQSFLDNIVAGFRPNLSLNDPWLDDVHRAPALPCIESDFLWPNTFRSGCGRNSVFSMLRKHRHCKTSNKSFVGCGRIPPTSLRNQLTSSWPCSSRTSPAMTSQKLCRLVLFARVRQSEGNISKIANSSLTRPLHDGHEGSVCFR